MDSTQQNTQPVENQQVASQPLDQPQADNSASADDPKESKSPKSDNKLMFLIIGAVLVLAIILIVIIFSRTLGKSNKPAVPTPQAQQIITPTPSDQNQEIVSKQPITSQQDVLNALQQVENSNPDAVGADLDKNTADASQFSQ